MRVARIENGAQRAHKARAREFGRQRGDRAVERLIDVAADDFEEAESHTDEQLEENARPTLRKRGECVGELHIYNVYAKEWKHKYVHAYSLIKAKETC